MPINSFDHYPMSWKPDRNRLTRPFYRSLAQLLEHDITHGLLAPGTKLPPQRELADFLDINFTTITRAYKLCELKGLIYGVTGNGTFVSANAARSVTISKEFSSEGYIDLSFVSSFEQTNEIVAEAARTVVGKRYLEQLLNYNDPSGIAHHKQAALNWMQPFGIEANVDQVAIVSGAQNAIAISLLACFEAANRIAVDQFTYSNFIELAKLYQIKLVPVAGDEHGMLPNELDALCSQLNIQGIFLMPSCSNPGAIMMPEARKQAVAQVIEKHNLLLIEDDIHAFLSAGYVEQYSKPMYQLLPQQTIYICSTAKSICSGLRVAYMVFNSTLKEKVLKAIYNVNVKTSSLDAEIITELILSGKAREIVELKRNYAIESNHIFNEVFPQLQSEEHPLSFYRCLPLPVDGRYSEHYFMDYGIRVFHSSRFLSGTHTEQSFLRVALSSTQSMDELRIGLEVLKKCLEN